MSNFDGKFMETTSFWGPPSSPSPRTILALLNQTDDGFNSITEMFPESRYQSEQRSGLRERLASRIEFNPPTLEIENISSFASFFRNTNNVSSPIVGISPRFSPSVLLQSPNMFSNSPKMNISSPAANNEPQDMVESGGEGNATTMIPDNGLAHHEPVNADLPPPSQEGPVDIPTEESVYIPSHQSHVEPLDAPIVPSLESEVVDHANSINIISIDEESDEGEDDDKDKDEDYYEEEEVEDNGEDEDEELEVEKDEDVVAKQDVVQPSSSKRRRYETPTNMIGSIRTSKQQRIIIQMESDEDFPNDGFRWRKYGQKVVKGNLNPRSYYKCTYEMCKVKKLVERGADDINIVVTTYDGKHQHNSPIPRASKTRPGPSMPSQAVQTNQTTQLGRPPFSVDMTPPFTSLAPPMDMTQLYMTGLSMLSNLPVNNQNTSFMYQNDAPRMDASPNNMGVYKGIMNRLFVGRKY